MICSMRQDRIVLNRFFNEGYVGIHPEASRWSRTSLKADVPKPGQPARGFSTVIGTGSGTGAFAGSSAPALQMSVL